MMKRLIISLKILLLFTLLTGVIYPLLITGIAQVVFPVKSNGSFVVRNGEIRGSVLIGQKFDSAAYFSSRPSHIAYNPLPSGGSNYGLTNTEFRNLVNERKDKFITFNSLDTLTQVPSEMVFESASGLDPHISLQAALLQAGRIAEYRKFSLEQRQKLHDLMEKLTEEPQFHLLGKERINVFLLNLGLDTIK